MTTIYEDERSIRKIVYSHKSLAAWIRGVDGVTKIEAYHENGEMAHVVWFKIWIGDYLFARVNGKYIDTVYYGDKK